ncbi:MAG TPA: thiolase family protein, partial [Chloroflexota bacterium]|nr:thiolase family protein [Chloroflexota bacterium]
MRFERAFIPLGMAWSSPFARWQGPLAEVSSFDLAAGVTRRALGERGVPPEALSQVVYGWTVPQEGGFYGAPTFAGRIGAPGITGPMISQACATSVACVQAAAAGLESGEQGATLVVAADRTSNGPLLIYPAPSEQGGAPRTENWIFENFRRDPWAGEAMVATAENVAREAGIGRQEQEDVTVLRYEQYARSLAGDRAFQRRYIVPAEVPVRRETVCVEADTGIHSTTAEGLAKLKTLDPNGTVTFGTQTHPADGAAGLLVTDEQRARELGQGGVARILGTGVARVGKALMPKAPVPAAEVSLRDAGLTFDDVHAVTTHNPFAVNDVYFARQTGFPLERMNQYG